MSTILRSLIVITLCVGSSTAALADDFVIDGAATTTNNGDVSDGADTITVTTSGSVVTTADQEHGLYSEGDNNGLTNSGDVSTTGEEADGLKVVGGNNELTNSGNLSTSGTLADGLQAVGDNNVLTNSGDLSTVGNSADGLQAVGDNNVLTNSGDLSTGTKTLQHGTSWNGAPFSYYVRTGSNSHGLHTEGDNNDLTNSGNLSTAGSAADGLRAVGDNNVLTNDGDINVDGGSAHGLSTTYYSTGGDFNTLTNSGNITVDGGSGNGLFSVGDSNVLTNSGNINVNEIVGGSGHGLSAAYYTTGGDFNTLTNSGNITVDGGSGDGLFAVGDGNVLINSGNINVNETRGGSGNGISAAYYTSGGDFNTVTNSGNIRVNGGYGHGLYASGFSNVLTNSGNIRVNGGYGHGLFSVGDSNVLTNSGNISVNETGGGNGHGLSTGNYLGGDFNTLTNSGTVTVSGVDGNGMNANGNSNTITNSGTVLSELAYSVSMTGTDATLNLLSGSVLSGKVDFSDLHTATLNFGSGLNAAVTLSSEIPSSGFTITAPGPVTVLEDTVYVADLGDVAAQNRVNTVATRMIHDAVASRGIVPAVTQGSSQPGTWASVSGGLVRNNGDANLSGYDGNVVSGSFGRDRLDGTSTFGGVSLTQTKTDNGVATDAIGVHGGIYGQLAGADYTLSGGLGYLDTERERANNMLASGLETASDSYLSAFISPAMTWHGVLGDNDSLRLRYTGTFYGSQSFDYEGEGDLEVESRITHQIEVRMAWARVIETGTIRYGFDLGYQSDDAMDLTLAGQNLSATTPGDAAYGRVFASMDFANATVEASYDNNNEFGLTGSYSWRF
jgi:hypothetical protein